MFKRKLKALQYLEWDKVNGNDAKHFRKLVSWLEDQKIRQYKIEVRKALRDIDSKDWPKTFAKYCDDVACPITTGPIDQLEWIIGFAVKLEFEDNFTEYQKAMQINSKKKPETVAPSIKSVNPLDTLNFQSDEFKNGVHDLAKLLRIPEHSDHLITLEACSKIICKRLNPDALQNPNSVIVTGKALPILDAELGFDMGDPVLNNAGKILRLLYIHDLRALQTQINETIVNVQKVTANPKTDSKLGRVGI